MEQIVWKAGFEPATSRVQGGETTTVIFPVFQIHFNFFSERQSDRKFSVNLCGLCEIVHYRIYFFSIEFTNALHFELAVPERQSGRLAITSIDLFCDLDRIVHELHISLMVFTNTSYFEPVTLGLENRCSIQLSYEIFVTPERFELSTPGLKDRCSNHLSYEIVLICEWSIVNSLCLSIFNSLETKFTFDCSHFCNPRRTRTFNLRRIRPMLQPIEL